MATKEEKLTKRITISLPAASYQRLKVAVGKGNVSGFVADAIDDKIYSQTVPALTPSESLKLMQEEFAALNISKEEVRRMMRHNRDGLV